MVAEQKVKPVNGRLAPTHLLASTIFGILYVTVQLRVSTLSHLSAVLQVALGFCVVLPVTWILVARFGSACVIPLMFLGGVGLAVLADAALDIKERNLFPLEIIWWWLLLVPSCAGGALLGHLGRRSKD